MLASYIYVYTRAKFKIKVQSVQKRDRGNGRKDGHDPSYYFAR